VADFLARRDWSDDLLIDPTMSTDFVPFDHQDRVIGLAVAIVRGQPRNVDALVSYTESTEISEEILSSLVEVRPRGHSKTPATVFILGMIP
jgi:hypothetical protein